MSVACHACSNTGATASKPSFINELSACIGIHWRYFGRNIGPRGGDPTYSVGGREWSAIRQRSCMEKVRWRKEKGFTGHRKRRGEEKKIRGKRKKRESGREMKRKETSSGCQVEKEKEEKG